MNYKCLAFLLLFTLLLFADDWAKIIIKDSGQAVNFWGSKEWTIGQVIQSNRLDIIGSTIRLNVMSGGRGDTVLVSRQPQTGYWYLK